MDNFNGSEYTDESIDIVRVSKLTKEENMKANVGGIDRALRVVVGLVLIGLAVTGTVGWWGWWGWLGVIPLATGLFRFCPAYFLTGARTCPLKSNK